MRAHPNLSRHSNLDQGQLGLPVPGHCACPASGLTSSGKLGNCSGAAVPSNAATMSWKDRYLPEGHV